MTFVIYEAGINHNGSLNKALDMVEIAKECGADAVKYQLFNPELFPAEKRHILRPLALDYESMSEIARRCDSVGIEFMCTGFDKLAVDFIVTLGVRRLKVSSQSVKDLDLMQHIGSKSLPVYISDGLSSNTAMKAAISHFGQRWVWMSCISKYPTPDKNVSMERIADLVSDYDCDCVGHSSHTVGLWDCVAAANRVETIEKHGTISRSLGGPDQCCSLEPNEFKAMVREIRWQDEN